ncbi:MAG TPA: helicase HerA-like domain-containing protein [Candidatus Lokiarchaeia archaeon]|nr:helicase HerA-like domain-containing protein [Candidatus Lokiarchaeia archaeon]
MSKKKSNDDGACNSFSVTNIKLALQCPRIFYLNKFYKERPFPFTGVLLGSIVHEIIDKIVKKLRTETLVGPFLTEDGGIDVDKFEEELKAFAYSLYYEKFKDFPTKFQSLEEIRKNTVLGWDLINRALDVIMNLIKKAFLLYPSEEAFAKVFLANERSFKMKIPEISDDFTLTGRLDSLWMDVSDGTIQLIDFKTGPLENIATDFSQIILYAYAIYNELHFRPRYSLFYLSQDEIEERSGTWTDVENLIPGVFEVMRNMCTWAQDKNSCPKTEMISMCGSCHLYLKCKRYFANDPPPTREEISMQMPSTPSVPSTSPALAPETNQESTSAENEAETTLPSRVTGEESTPASVKCDEAETLEIGHVLDKPEIPALLDVTHLNRHVAIIGSTGCGKTVLSKVIVEELLYLGYSCILIDPQGDLCSLMIPKDEIGKDLNLNVNFKILTPGSKKGIPLSFDMFEPPPEELLADEEYMNMQLDQIATNIINTVGIDAKKSIPPEKTLVESLIKTCWIQKMPLNLQSLAEYIQDADEFESISSGEKIPISQLITKQKQTQLGQKLMSLSAGTEGFLFSQGYSLDISKLLEEGPSCYIINLQGLGGDQNKRQLILSWIIQRIYNWMLTHSQNCQDALRLCFYIDEVADFLPVSPSNPPSKKLLSILIRQARKYGVGVMVATQSPALIDYRVLDNVSTYFIGKIPSQQSAKKIGDLISPYFSKDPLNFERTMKTIRKTNTGEFLVVQNGSLSNTFVKVRILHTEHRNIPFDQIPSIQQVN